VAVVAVAELASDVYKDLVDKRLVVVVVVVVVAAVVVSATAATLESLVESTTAITETLSVLVDFKAPPTVVPSSLREPVAIAAAFS